MNYVNRHGEVYYIFQGITKTGKPRYYVSRKDHSETGKQIDSLPKEYEIYEAPTDARVGVRKKLPSPIHDFEVEFVRQQASALAQNVATILDIRGASIAVYESPIDSYASSSMIARGLPTHAIRLMQSYRNFSPAFRFTLIDEQERTFEIERFCFLGRIDDWINLYDDGSLKKLCQRYLKHLGQESFYELM